jgi:hypothetical protein
MKKLGYTSVKIHTQTNTWLACKIYYDLGFHPEANSAAKYRFGWKMVSQLTGRDMIAETLGCKTFGVSVAIKEVDEDDCKLQLPV